MLTASIVVHKNPEPQLKKIINSLKQSSVNKIYIIDNSPSDGLRHLFENEEKFNYLKTENHGFGAGHNIAIKKSIEENADYHLIVNPDVFWDGDIIKTMIEFMERHQKVGLISPKTFYPDGDLQYTCRMLPTPVDLFLKRFLPKRLSESRMNKYLIKEHDHDYPLNCPYLLGSFILFRVKALKDCGIFDERFFMYPEDIDITRRIHEKWETLYFPDVFIIHEHQAASRKNAKMLKIHLFNMIKYFNKWGWWKDEKRRKFNNEMLISIKPLAMGKIQKGRG